MKPADRNLAHETLLLPKDPNNLSYELGDHIKQNGPQLRSKSSNNRRNSQSGGSLNWKDILLTLIRHRWVIIVLAILGFGAAAGVYLTQEPTYRSTAKLMVRYIMKSSALDSFEKRSETEGRLAENLLFGELQILQSLDTAKAAAADLGTEILTAEEQQTAEDPFLLTTSRISSGLTSFVVYNTNVIEVSYDDQDPGNSQKVLDSVIENYLQRHLEIHRSMGTTQAIERRVAAVRAKLDATEERLQALKQQEGVISLAGASSSLEEQRSQLAGEFLEAEIALAAEQERSKAFRAHRDTIEAAILAQTGSSKSNEAIPSEIGQRYSEVMQSLERKVRALEERLLTYTPRDYLVQKMVEQVAALRKNRVDLVSNYPALLSHDDKGSSRQFETEMSSDELQESQLAAAQARLAKIEEHMTALDARFAAWTPISAEITDLERQLRHQNKSYDLLQRNLENARTDESLDSSKLSNINILQSPSEAIPVANETTKKIVLGLAASGLCLGLGLAFLMEFFDRRIREPGELPVRLNVPLLLSIPELRQISSSTQVRRSEPEKIGDSSKFPVTQMVRDNLRPWAETIRNRLIFNYDINQVTHKPKIIGVTSGSKSAGATTLATSLASAFAEIDNSKVLYIDLSQDELISAWKTLSNGSRESALATQSESDGIDADFRKIQLPAPRVHGLNNRPLVLQDLLPELRKSAYDYVIIDMPELKENSPTFSLACMVDQMLLVLGAQNTSRDSLTRNFSDLQRLNPNISCIFNKTKSTRSSWLVG